MFFFSPEILHVFKLSHLNLIYISTYSYMEKALFCVNWQNQAHESTYKWATSVMPDCIHKRYICDSNE